MRFWLENVAIVLCAMLVVLAMLMLWFSMPDIVWQWLSWAVIFLMLPSIAFMAMVLFIAWVRSGDDRPNY